MVQKRPTAADWMQRRSDFVSWLNETKSSLQIRHLVAAFLAVPLFAAAQICLNFRELSIDRVAIAENGRVFATIEERTVGYPTALYGWTPNLSEKRRLYAPGSFDMTHGMVTNGADDNDWDRTRAVFRLVDRHCHRDRVEPHRGNGELPCLFSWQCLFRGG